MAEKSDDRKKVGGREAFLLRARMDPAMGQFVLFSDRSFLENRLKSESRSVTFRIACC